jgi:hypothetical protein
VQTRRLKFLGEIGRGRELRNAAGQVTKRVALMGEDLGHPRHEMEKIKIPKEFPRHGRRAEFQKGKRSPSPEHSDDFGQSLFTVGKIAETKSQGNGIELGIGKGKFQRIPLHGMFESAGSGLGEKRGTEVQPGDRGFGTGSLESQGHIPGATGNIENGGWIGLDHSLDEVPPPEGIEAEAEDTVVAVVGGGEVDKEGMDGRGIGHGNQIKMKMKMKEGYGLQAEGCRWLGALSSKFW